MRKALLLCAVVALASLGLVACGGGNDNGSASVSTPATPPPSTSGGSAGGGGTTLDIAADPSALKFDTTSLDAKAGAVTINFDNPSAIGHDVVIEDSGGAEIAKTDVITQAKATAKANLKPGSYTFFCSVDGHRQAGMEGTLTVK
jgi:plastocyanin